MLAGRLCVVCALLAAACGDMQGGAGTTQVTGFESSAPPDPTITEPIETSTTGVATTTTDTSSTSTTEDPFESDTATPDLGTTKGCRGKIDFLISINRSFAVEPFYPNMLAALADFRVMLEERYADFDLHVMVVAGDIMVWGIEGCEDECVANNGDGCAPLGPEDYPCAAYGGQLTSCDQTFGAGSTFPAAFGGSNKRCPLADGRRYITRDDDLGEVFPCMTRQGLVNDVAGLTAWAMTYALDPERLEPAACNAGFVRDDALLVVTLVSRPVGEANPSEQWMESLYAAKGDDPDAFVVLGILGDHAQPNALCGNEGDGSYQYPLQKFVNEVPQGMWTSLCADDHTPFFEEAAAMIDAACEDFVPM